MLSTDRMSFNYRLFPERLSRLFGPAVREQKDMDHWRYDMMGQTMLIRNADGDYTPAHRSLLEFFVAYKFAAELGALAPDFAEPAQKQSYTDASAPPQDYAWSAYFRREPDASGAARPAAPLDTFAPETADRLVTTLGKEPLGAAVLDLLKNMLDPSGAATARLLSILDRTRGDQAPADTAYLGGNLATLLTRRDPLVLKGRDLSRANLSAASFLNADLTRTNFRACLYTSKVFLRSLPSLGEVLELEFPLEAVSRESRSLGVNLGDVAFDPSGKLLAGGYRGAIVLWDARPFIKRSGEPHINIVEYRPPELGAISDDPETWPDWWRRCKIEVPEGMVPNPDFGKCLRVIEQKLRCGGLQITGAKGLDETSSTYDIDETSSAYDEGTLGAWLVMRGAVRSERGGKSEPERKAGRGRKVEG